MPLFCFVALVCGQLTALVNLGTPLYLTEVARSCGGICGAAWEPARGRSPEATPRARPRALGTGSGRPRAARAAGPGEAAGGGQGPGPGALAPARPPECLLLCGAPAQGAGRPCR